jgi:two-component system LytT family sensor kinase
MGLLAIVTFSKFSFADRFVKQSILILTSVLIALLFHGLILQPAIRVVGARSPYPTAAEWVVRILLWAMLLLCFPELKRRLDEIVDRLLFQRPDYRRLTQSFSQLFDQAEDESRVFELTETTIRESLNIPTLRLVAEEAIELHPESSAITPLSADHPLRRHRPELEWFLPLESNGRITEIIALAPGKDARRLLSDELDFLNGLSERAGRRLDALKFENERRERALAMERMQHLLTQAELRALQAQINPHFLFNTLNTIADLIGRSPEKAETLTEQLAEIFRYALQKSGASEVSLKDEIQFLKTYLEIEQTRFGSRLTVDLQIDEDVSEALIPPLLLQPLVENAVKHGIAQSLGGGRLEVRAYRADQELRLSVANDRGDWREGSLTGHSGGHGLGLRNIRERLSALYGPRASLEIASEPGRGTRVLITIPDDETQNIDRGRRGAGEIAPEKTHRRAS